MVPKDLRVPSEQVDVDGARHEMLIARLEYAGWTAFGARSDGTIDEGFCRLGGRYDLSPDETAIRLGLVDDDGNLLTGFHIQAANAVGATIIQYSGAEDDRYGQFMEDLHDLGWSLTHQLEAEDPEFGALLAQARATMSPGEEAVAKFSSIGAIISESTNKLMRQIDSAEVDNGTIKALMGVGTPREEAIASVVSVVASTFCEDLPGDSMKEPVDFLVRWHGHVDYRYTKLLEALQAQYTGADLEGFLATNPVLGKLWGIREGVRRALKTSQEIAAQTAEEPTILSPELIREQTGYTLNQTFTDFAKSGRISPDLHEERERLSVALGEDNVLTSMYLDDAGEIQLGLFVKEAE